LRPYVGKQIIDILPSLKECVVRLSVNTRYAVRLLCALAQSDRPVSLSALAERIGTSKRALENVHAVLKRHGLTEGMVGPNGGIVLKRALSEISIGDLLLWLDDAVDLCLCRTGQSACCPEGGGCPARANWKRISSRIQGGFNAVTLAEVMHM
jgi:Rrf2 family iron-sulfur cluster assembly transcriptional regulator